jgi:hypothetical protein
MLILSCAYIRKRLYKGWLMLGKPPQFYHVESAGVKLFLYHTWFVGAFEKC